MARADPETLERLWPLGEVVVADTALEADHRRREYVLRKHRQDLIRLLQGEILSVLWPF